MVSDETLAELEEISQHPIDYSTDPATMMCRAGEDCTCSARTQEVPEWDIQPDSTDHNTAHVVHRGRLVATIKSADTTTMNGRGGRVITGQLFVVSRPNNLNPEKSMEVGDWWSYR